MVFPQISRKALRTVAVVVSTGRGDANSLSNPDQTNFVACSPQDNYTDRATAACRRS
jgi:hypothetical protein